MSKTYTGGKYMPEEFNVAELFRDTIYSWETWGSALKFFIPFAIAAVILLALKTLLNALARYIKRKRK